MRRFPILWYTYWVDVAKFFFDIIESAVKNLSFRTNVGRTVLVLRVHLEPLLLLLGALRC